MTYKKKNRPAASEKITEYDGGQYWLTAASWVNVLGEKTYEIGIREKASNRFWLLQSDKYN